MGRTGRLRGWMRDKWHDPVAWTETIQLVKTAIATVLAWVIAVHVFALPAAFLAPWSALLVVNATVYRTFSRGLQQVAATVAGVLLAWVVGNTLGLDPLALTVLMLVGLTIGNIAWLREESTTVAATALIVVTTGFATNGEVLVARLLDTAIGIIVGLAVNMLVWPPLRDYSAAKAIDNLNGDVGVLLRDIAGALRDGCQEDTVADWVDRTRDLDRDIDAAWGRLRQAWESGRFNPRKEAREVRTPGEWRDLLHRIEQTVAEIRSMARTLGHSISNVNLWEPEFKEPWLDLLDGAGEAMANPSSKQLVDVRRRLSRLAGDLSTDRLSALHWPEYGALIVNLRNIVTSMDRVTASNPVTPSVENRRRPLLRG